MFALGSHWRGILLWAASFYVLIKSSVNCAEIFRHFAPRVKAFLMKSGMDAAMAEDIEQGMSQIRAALENDTEERRLDASALVK